MSGSCVECERTAAMGQKKELECDGSIRPGDVSGVRLQIRAAAAAAVQLKSNQRSSKMRCVKMRLVPKRSERSRKKAGERGRRGALKEQKGRKGKDAGCSSLSGAAFRVWAPSSRRSSSKTPRLCRAVTSQPILPPPAPTTSLVFPSPPLLDEKIGVPGRASWFGGGRGVDPHSCSPFKQSSKPSWISNKNLCRETACRWQCDAVPPPAPPPRLTS